MDADALDKTGILAIIWDSLAIAAENNTAGYRDVFDRIMAYEDKRNASTPQFKTLTGELLYKDRQTALRKALSEFQYELGL